MKRSKERLELLEKLGSGLEDLIGVMAKNNELTLLEVIELCTNLTAFVSGSIYSRMSCDLDVVKYAAQATGGDVSRGIIRAYLLFEKKKYNEERDNTSKDPA